jgi:hypothetical protein
MKSFELFAALLFGAIFALFAFWRVRIVDSQAIRGVIAAFLFGTYCAVVAFGTGEKKRTLSLSSQTLLGMALACALGALFGASPMDYMILIVAGLALGLTAHFWVNWVQLP